MLSEKQVIEMIIDLEALQYNESDEYEEYGDAYLDEGQQAELSALYTVLDRDLTPAEQKRIKKKAKELGAI